MYFNHCTTSSTPPFKGNRPGNAHELLPARYSGIIPGGAGDHVMVKIESRPPICQVCAQSMKEANFIFNIR